MVSMFLDFDGEIFMQSFQIITGRKINIGIVGCGRISKNHFLAISEHKSDLCLRAVCDIDEPLLDETTSKFKVKGYNSMEKMLVNEDLDLVALCTPSGLHPEQAELAARYKVNVLSEKPMATDFESALRMVKICNDHNVRLFVVKQNRKNATLQLLKRAIDDYRFGEIKLVHVNVFWTRPQEYYDQGGGWRGTWKLDGGAFMNQASHYVDLLDWMIGPVQCVHAMTSTTRNIEAEDTGVLNIRWNNGALGSMAVSMLTYPKNLEGSITILGEKGTVKIGGVAVNEIKTWEFEDYNKYDDEVTKANYETTSVYGFGHPNYYRNVVEVLRGVAEPEVDGNDGLKSLELIVAAYRSAQNNRPIYLPLERFN